MVANARDASAGGDKDKWIPGAWGSLASQFILLGKYKASENPYLQIFFKKWTVFDEW